MKKLVLMLLCVGFANFAMANESPNLQIPADANTTLTTQFENIKTLEFPKDEKEEKELDELFDAIYHFDMDKMRKLINKNPKLLNLQKKVNEDARMSPLIDMVMIYFKISEPKNNEIIFDNIKFLLDSGADANIYYFDNTNNATMNLLNFLISAPFITGNMNDDNLKLIDFLVINDKLDLNKFSSKVDNVTLYAPANMLAATNNINNDYKFNFFKFFIKHKANLKGVLSYITFSDLGKVANKLTGKELEQYLKGNEYQKLREYYKKYLYEIFTNYLVEELDMQDLSCAVSYFSHTNDMEFMKLMVDNGYMKNSELADLALKNAEKSQNTKMINLLKGSRQ